MNEPIKVTKANYDLLVNAADWLAIMVCQHSKECTCGACYAVARAADLIESKHSRYIADQIRKNLSHLFHEELKRKIR